MAWSPDADPHNRDWSKRTVDVELSTVPGLRDFLRFNHMTPAAFRELVVYEFNREFFEPMLRQIEEHPDAG